MNEMTQEIYIPSVIEDAFGLAEGYETRHLSGGSVNETMLVSSGEQQLILRKLSPVLGTLTIHKTCVIANHLSEKGWEAPLITPTRNHQPYLYDESGHIWHGMAYIESDDAGPKTINSDFIGSSGQLIGKWHRDVQDLNHTPESLPHFHDTQYVAQKIKNEMTLFNPQQTELAQGFIREYEGLADKMDLSSPQIVHGDPKLDNMLYRNGTPFTLIDLDCSQVASRWIDIGDFLRSVQGKLLSKQLEYIGDTDVTTEVFMEGYVDNKEIKNPGQELTIKALVAAKAITTELGMRYLSDIVDGTHYFSWDRHAYQSRQDALYDKALLQLSILDEFKRILNER